MHLHSEENYPAVSSNKPPLAQLLSERLEKFEQTGQVAYLLAAIATMKGGDQFAVIRFVDDMANHARPSRQFKQLVREQLARQHSAELHCRAWELACDGKTMRPINEEDIKILQNFPKMVGRNKGTDLTSPAALCQIMN